MRVERGCTLMPCWNGMYCVVCSGSPGSSSGVQRCLCTRRLLCSRSTVLYSAVHHSIPQSITAYFRTRARLGLWYSWRISLYGLLQHKTCLVEMPRQRHPRSRLSHVSYHPRVRALLFGPRADSLAETDDIQRHSNGSTLVYQLRSTFTAVQGGGLG